MKEITRNKISQVFWGAFWGAAFVLIFGGPSSTNSHTQRLRSESTEDKLDEMIEETFPASDAPSY